MVTAVQDSPLIKCSRAVNIAPDLFLGDLSIQNLSEFDIFVFPGGLGILVFSFSPKVAAETFATDLNVQALLERFLPDPSKLICMICAGTFFAQIHIHQLQSLF